MASVLHRSRDDTELARRVSGGDSAAFALLDARHRNALTRYAGSLLRRSEHDAEDVVQDVLIRAHDALRAGDVPDDLRPWLYRRMVYLGLVEPMRRAPLDWQPTRDTVSGRSTTARLDLRQRDPTRVAKGTIGIICRRPAANGSLSPDPRRLRPGERAAHVCPGRWAVPILRSPNGARFHRLSPGEPVAIQRRNATGRWTLVAHDYDPLWVRGKEPGWIRTSELCA